MARQASTAQRASASHPGQVDLFDGTHPEARDMNQIQAVVKWLDLLARHYFRTEVMGFDNVPDQSALVVGTHNGGLLASDMAMFFHAWHRRFGAQRPLYGLAHDMHFNSPMTREVMARAGAIRANKDIAKEVLRRSRHYVAVYPSGARELFKPYYNRGKIDFGGHKGFVKLALEAQVPIIPTVAYGADTFVVLNKGDWTAKLLGADKLLRMPVWPWMLCLPWGLALGPVPHLPLPGQIRLSVGSPIYLPYGPEAAKDPRVVEEVYLKVQSTMQAMSDRLGKLHPAPQPVWKRALELKDHLEAFYVEARELIAGVEEERREALRQAG